MGSVSCDRISSSLPDEILQSILSRMPLKSVMATSVLARRWRYLWKHNLASATSLDFDEEFASSQSPQEFVANVHRYLQFHHGSLQRLRILFYPFDVFLDDVEKWIAIATTKGVTHLDLGIFQGYKDPRDGGGFDQAFKLPPCLFQYKMLTHLSLNQCDFFPPPPPPPPGVVAGVCQLQYLSLTNVSITKDTLQQLISDSPFLDNLSLVLLPPGDDDLELGSFIISSQSLRKLTIMNQYGNPYDMIEITAPKLESFIYCGVYHFGDGLSQEPIESFIDISSLSDAFICCVDSGEPEHDFIKLLYDLRHVKVLTACLCSLWPWVKGYNDYSGDDERFPILLQNLKELQLLVGTFSSEELDYVYNFFRLCPSPFLEKLFIQLSEYPEGYGKPSYWKEVVVEEPLGVNFCHLKVIKLSNFKGCKSEMRLVRFLLEKSLVLESLVLVAPAPKPDKECIEYIYQAKYSAPDLRMQLSLFSKASPGANIVLCEFLEDDMSVAPTHTEYFAGICQHI